MKLGLQAYCGYIQVCVKMAPVVQIFGPFLVPNKAKIGQYISFCLFSWKNSAWFIWTLIYKLIWATFVGV